MNGRDANPGRFSFRDRSLGRFPIADLSFRGEDLDCGFFPLLFQRFASTVTPSPAIPVQAPAATWTQTLQAAPRGLVLAREKGWLLAWDDARWLYLLNQAGRLEGQAQQPGAIAAACCADDGSALAVLSQGGAVSWLAPDLTVRWQHQLPAKPMAAALDSFGQYLAVADQAGTLHVLDRLGRVVTTTPGPLAFHHLTFVPAAPVLLASAELGLIVCMDLAGKTTWRDSLVIHVGGLAVTSGGEQILLACFTEGLHRYSLAGRKLKPISTVEPWQRVAVSADGRHILAGGLSQRLYVLDDNGRTRRTLTVDHPPAAVALDPLGRAAYAALPDRRIVAFDLSDPR